MNVFINEQPEDILPTDLPMLISGSEGFGASHFSVRLLQQLFRQGSKVLLFSAYAPAKTSFREGLTDDELSEVEETTAGADAVGKRALLISRVDEAALIETLAALQDKEDRIVLVKNIDQYGPAVLDAVAGLSQVILSGDADQCRFADGLAETGFVTKVFFSPSERLPLDGFPEIKKYQAYAVGERLNGVLSWEA